MRDWIACFEGKCPRLESGMGSGAEGESTDDVQKFGTINRSSQ